ncbi:Cytosine deaminase [Tumidithrix helvetica PCC 7403]|uniref:cytosine deaminase n=1 Tax=Tumidithrix helvetica TaxID=3457545 RepID=UPI003CB89B4E
MFPDLPDRYWLCNVRVPACLISGLISESVAIETDLDGLALLNIEVRNGKIATILNSPLSSQIPLEDVLQVDWHHGIALPCFIDVHTHLDKGHIWNRSPNPDGTFESALRAVAQDRDTRWTYEDVYRRMEFGLKCSYAHGTKAIRTHIDCPETQIAASLKAFQELRDIWRDRLYLQPVSLISLDLFMGDYGEQVANRIAELGGILGGVAYVNRDLEPQLDRLFCLAKDRGLDLDFHVDETDDPESNTLLHVAEAAIRNGFTGQIVCGHCCSLAVQDTEVAMKTIDLVKQAGIGVISLPLCNLYLQDRGSNRTPRWRGVTLLHELREAGVPVAIASDNCRDPFYGFGDHDLLQIFTMSTQICHLDRPYGNWARTVTQTPANFMKLEDAGQLRVGSSADLILCKARSFSELFSRPQSDRIVLRNGQAIDTTLPNYSELD